MRRFLPVRLSLLALVACAGPTAPFAPSTGAPSDADTPDGDEARTALRGWSQAFVEVEGGYWAAVPDRSLLGHHSATGPRLESEDALVSVRLARWGRDAAPVAVPDRAPRLGDCVAVGLDGGCAEPVEYVSPGLVEWWVTTEEGLEQGWTVAEAPAGTGDLVLSLDVDAEVVFVDGEPQILAAEGATIAVTALAAWDADGAPLDATFAATGSGFAIRVDDAAARYPITVDPVYTAAGTRLEMSDYASGSSRRANNLAALGDVNGDGYADFAVADSTYTWIFHGGATSSAWDSYATFKSLGTATYLTTVGGGDINNDGYDDIVVGDPRYETLKGRVYVYNGSATGVSSSAARSYLSTTAYEELGGGIAVADLNGDGYADVVIGSPGYSTSRGRLQIFHGSASGLGATATTTINGTTTYEYLGGNLAPGGDINGDGYADLLSAQPSYGSSAGRVVVYFGSASGLSSSSTATLSGVSAGDYFGFGTASAGDVNADGYDDVIVGAWGYDGDAGRVYVFHGRSTGIGTSAATVLTGGAAEELGWGVDGAGDVDGDGYDDVIVGSTNYDSLWGGAFLYLGGSAGVATTSTSTFDSPYLVVAFGEKVGGVGDLDADGFDDVAVAGYRFGDGSYTYPVAYAYRGYRDADGDGYSSLLDCDDDDATFYPGAVEIAGDNVDQNCDEQEACYYDSDDDGYRTATTFTSTDADCDDAGEALATDATGECNDVNAAVRPGATELVGDGVDSDCADGELCYADADNDNNRLTTTVVSADGDCRDSGEGLATDPEGDCDDASATVYVGASEVVGDGIDQSCDGVESCYVDADDDGYRATETVASEDADCDDPGEGLAADPTGDCDETNADAYPGASEITGTGADEDCDGHEVCYADGDGDTYGTYATSYSADADCDDPGESRFGGADCDDTDASVNPGAVDTPADGEDGDCDGVESCYADADADGYRTTTSIDSDDRDCTDPGEATTTVTSGDCDDGNPLMNPGAVEIVADGYDNDCDGTESCYVDADDDGYRTSTLVASEDGDCTDPGEATSSAPSTDCDDGAASVSPGAVEGAGDEVDGNCDGAESCYADADGDGVRTDAVVASTDTDCADPGEAAASLAAGDCDDATATIHPGAIEAVGDEVDGDCDGGEACYVDADADAWRTDATVASADADCTDAGEAAAAVGAGDCDDADATVSPGAAEVVDDGVDTNCDGGDQCYADADGDSFRDATTVASPDLACTGDGEAGAAAGVDCDDTDAAVFPGATETPGDEVDGDCDGGEDCYVDADGDGFRIVATIPSDDADCADAGEAPAATPSPDCDDGDAATNPGARDTPDDGVDQDCDGADLTVDDDDPGTDGSDDGGCACSPGTGAPSGAALAVLLVGLVAGRRRR